MKEFVLLPFAAWRITSLLVDESGPFEVFEKIRYALGVRYNKYGNSYGKNEIAKAMTCTWCVSLWVSLFGIILYFITPKLLFGLELPFAIGTVVIMIDKVINGQS